MPQSLSRGFNLLPMSSSCRRVIMTVTPFRMFIQFFSLLLLFIFYFEFCDIYIYFIIFYFFILITLFFNFILIICSLFLFTFIIIYLIHPYKLLVDQQLKV